MSTTPESNTAAETTEATSLSSSDNNDHPTTGLITMGGAMFFRPSDPTDSTILSVMVTKKEDLANSLDAATNETLEVIHLIVKSLEMNRLYDSDAIAVLKDKLLPGGELTVHVLSNGEEHSAPVSPEDVDEVRSSLLLAGLMLEVEGEGPGGAWTVSARKKVNTAYSEEDSDEESDS
uniref:Uncharacterized protein n=1 Tax=Grammatophora oceanica TaxID=210454 RepID=A0A7S1Y154_9STRA|mmetsp:Transcript_16837/g.24972  ORF Transcript_16837/g.24972 Transcript_16837/m.24972 type:complete len:177 (+) Transcript_16837:105-635(+)|eukprot:CAMPEP_0194064766 /NCGR_PEP_ID=MMETSP0009_2-20130614/83855_1 /TAXON_ID=210454 /ORGANISM="Grammatophora oceanica, Strain CCMP 410" /LENGTH=176 /DNA_ID=CAMNT_0038717361 /DNA_START=92 /DNA_END=622 /DNA_ORIENTATION=-